MAVSQPLCPPFSELRVVGRGLGCGSSPDLGIHSCGQYHPLPGPQCPHLQSGGRWTQVPEPCGTDTLEQSASLHTCPRVLSHRSESQVPLKDDP